MRKIGLFLLVIFSVITIINKEQKNEEIRVRIVPNSDEKRDILVKEEVKDYTIYYLKNAYDDNYDIFLNNINETKTDFQRFLKNVLGVDCIISFAKHTLYNKSYNNSAVKNEETMMLYIIIGKGEGSNWWGTVYPEFLEISSSEEIKYESLIIRMFDKLRGD